MRDSNHPNRLNRSPRARLLAASGLVSGVLVAGCGGSSGSPSVANVASSTTSTSTTTPEPRSASTGVISDIDGVILVFLGTIDEQSPAFTRAAAVCRFPLHNH